MAGAKVRIIVEMREVDPSALSNRGMPVLEFIRTINALVTEADASQIRELSEDPNVLYIDYSDEASHW